MVNNKVMVVEGGEGEQVSGVGGGEFEHLSEDCIANILSFTTPRDACVLSLVSSSFRSAAQSDVVWERFLPLNYKAIISESSEPLLTYSSKKELFLHLCHNPILIDSGKKSFALDKFSGKICCMLSARSLFIVWGDTPRYWRWTSRLPSRFCEVAELLSVCWLEMNGSIKSSMLSPNTKYGAYLVFKQRDGGFYGFENQPIDVSVGVAGEDECERRTVYLEAATPQRPRHQIVPRIFSRIRYRYLDAINDARAAAAATAAPASVDSCCSSSELGAKYPKQREDGWLEVELGDFFNGSGDDKEFQIVVSEIKSGGWKSGIILLGIELRPN